MKILIDADACPVTDITIQIAKEKEIEVRIFCDTSHIINSDYAEVFVVSQGADAVDFALLNQTEKNDIVVTQDYGVAAMVLGKEAHPIHQNGRWYTNENIDQMLFERHVLKKERRKSSKIHGKGIKKRTLEDDLKFEESFKNLIEKFK
ncbi:YaiI/YqxD family protein [Anaerosacchariphilus polymeriproducens]|uniref:UPF0178 protein DWV06_04525 n=1 Tax=Anaerosacchariphilus polymeriproducens TaxID=1812858 RepID=A0A371AYW8_9FIRM|nr:YaiI/YqxD family protein [Anaerosacchariphilus polymeriproducens]RDU24739.1 YaiI/YqxD family protein [Anaerosacchariphilus polymeriproducens]